MVSFNTFSKLCVVVAFGLSATVTSTDVAQEQPQKEQTVSKFFRKSEEPDTKPVKVSEPTKTNTEEDAETRGVFKYDVEWLLKSEPESRAALLKAIPSDLAMHVPKDYKKRMWSGIEEYMYVFFKIYATEWYLLPEPESRAALRYVLPKDLAKEVPEDCKEPIDVAVKERIRELFSKTFQKERLLHSWNKVGYE